MDHEIYLNHAGTSWPKPESVFQAMANFRTSPTSNWSRQFESAHNAIASFFGLSDSHRLLLTPGCTSSLALAIADHPWESQDAIVISSWEHHAIHRPALKLQEMGVKVLTVPPSTDSPFDLDTLHQFLTKHNVRLVAVSAASNVTGDLLPIQEIIELSHQFDTLVLVDAAQSVGWLPLNLPKLDADIVAFGGHKGLQGPWGIGGLYVADRVTMNTPAAVCRIPAANESPCAPMPGYCDGGSVDRLALAGLHAAIEWLQHSDQSNRLARCRQLMQSLQVAVASLPNVIVYGHQSVDMRVPTIAFNIVGRESSEIASILAENHVFVGSGFQCAPLAHETLATSQSGTVRLSLGPTTSEEHLDRAIATLTSFIR